MDPRNVKKEKKKKREKNKNKESVPVVSNKTEQIYFKKGEPHIRRDGKLIPLSEVPDICL